jgi:serine/alanine adding enzyme
MKIKIYTTFSDFRSNGGFEPVGAFLRAHPHGNFFQSPAFFQLTDGLPGHQPVLLVASTEPGTIAGTLLAVLQSNGRGIKAWMSRRLIVWGGPLAADLPEATRSAAIRVLLDELNRFAQSRAIYVEFRNMFDTTAEKETFETLGFGYKAHLNYLVKTDEAQAVKKRMSSSRTRQINASLKAGATIEEVQNEDDIQEYYALLQKLYREKVKKPLASIELFLKFQRLNCGRFFVIKHGGKVVGGIVCPVFENKTIYEWYVCGEDGLVQGLHPSVLATWAPIEYGLKNGMEHFDFLGAGKPDQDYGVREFKARFGGEEVSFGRYEKIVNPGLYRVGKAGLTLLNKLQ